MNNPLSEQDIELFEKFEKLVVESETALNIMFKECFGSTFDARPLKPLRILNEQWYTASYSFLDKPLEKAWQEFRRANKKFFEKLNRSIFPKPNDKDLHYFGDRNEDNEEHIESITKEVNDLAKDWCDTYNHFVSSYRARASGSPIENDVADIHIISEKKMLGILTTPHALDKDVHEDWEGTFCDDGYLPLIKLAMPQYRGDYHILAWEKKNQTVDCFSENYHMKLFISEGNCRKVQLYDDKEILCVIFSYSELITTDNAIYKIYPTLLEIKRLNCKFDDGLLKKIPPMDKIVVRVANKKERAVLNSLFPHYFEPHQQETTKFVPPEYQAINLSRPERVRTQKETRSRYQAIVQNAPKYMLNPFPFWCPLNRWSGTKHVCIAYRTSRRLYKGQRVCHITLLLTSIPVDISNQVALYIIVIVPYYNDEIDDAIENEMAEPSVFNGKDELEDKAGKKWKVLESSFRDNLSQEESDIFKFAFESLEVEIEQRQNTEDAGSTYSTDHGKNHPLLKDISKDVKALVKDAQNRKTRLTKRNNQNRKNGGGKAKGDNRSGYDPMVVYQKIEQLKKKKTLKRACEDIVKTDSLNIQPESLAKAYRRYLGKP